MFLFYFVFVYFPFFILLAITRPMTFGCFTCSVTFWNVIFWMKFLNFRQKSSDFLQLDAAPRSLGGPQRAQRESPEFIATKKHQQQIELLRFPRHKIWRTSERVNMWKECENVFRLYIYFRSLTVKTNVGLFYGLAVTLLEGAFKKCKI